MEKTWRLNFYSRQTPKEPKVMSYRLYEKSTFYGIKIRKRYILSGHFLNYTHISKVLHTSTNKLVATSSANQDQH